MNPTLLILSGPTHEYIDPVRFIGNASSGKMGKALAEEALNRGWKVDFVTGPVSPENLPKGELLTLYPVVSAHEMLETARPLFLQAQLALFAAAVSDFKPDKFHAQKISRAAQSKMTLSLTPNPDIAQTLSSAPSLNRPKTVGFALQTHDSQNYARRKLEQKRLDGIILNTPASIGSKEGTFSWLEKGSDSFIQWGTISKKSCAQHLFDAITPWFSFAEGRTP